MIGLAGIILGWLALSAQQAEAAPPPPPEEDGDIVVTAPDNRQPVSDDEIIVEKPATQRERRNELRRMARATLNSANLEQAIGSYKQPMCPKVFGLPDGAATFIEKRMRANAVQAGLNHDDTPSDCDHNTSVIFVPASQGAASAWLDYRSDELGHLLSYERTRVLDEEGPVRAWFYRPTELPGPTFVPSAPLGPASDADRLALVSDPDRPFYAARARREANPIAASVVMIELPQANGKSLVQLADYASMRTFGNSRGISPDLVPAAQTILTLFQDEEAPEELTAFDRAMLSMLYETPETASPSLLLGNIARRAQRLELEGLAGSEGP